MASRPRRAAAQKANTAITDMVDSDNNNFSNSSSRFDRAMSSRTASRRSDAKLPASKLRQATSTRTGQANRQVSLGSRENFEGGEILQGKRPRRQKKSYVLDTSEDDDEDDEDVEADDLDAEGEDDDMADLSDDDAEGEIVVDDTMDIDAEGEDDDGLVDEDAEGEEDDMDIDATPVAPTIKVSRPAPSKNAKTSRVKSLKSSGKPITQAKDSDDDELSDLESEEDEIQDTVKVGGGGDDDEEDAEGEEDDEIEATGAVGDDDDEDLDSSDETPDLTKMTKRQRARFEDGDGGLMKLSDEVQAKKHFTAEELSMRRAEMARRRRNLSEKRNEEVKMETINKLLKKQAPKTKGKAQGDDNSDGDGHRANPIFVRWISNKDGSRIAVPDEMLTGPAGRVFVSGGLNSGKMVEEVS